MINPEHGVRHFTDWLDGDDHSAGSFASHAIGRPPRVETPVVRVGRADVWPKDVLEEIQRIYAEGEL